MAGLINGILDRIFAAGGAITLSQAPLFMQQYTHQLSGHISELRLQISVLRDAAVHSGKTLEQYIQKFSASSDPDFAKQGQILNGMLERYTSLSEAYNALSNTTVFAKPFVFLSHLNLAMVDSTFHNFQPGIAFTVEGLIYAIVGLGVGYGFYWMLSKFCYTIYQTLFAKQRRTELG